MCLIWMQIPDKNYQKKWFDLLAAYYLSNTIDEFIENNL